MDQIIIGLLVLMQAEIGAYIIFTKRPNRSAKYSRMTFIDTSVLMDGRIISAVQTGFIPGKLIIPKSVIAELQLLADGSDSDKRSRARHGLDVASLIQENPHSKVRVLDDGAYSGVDDQLLKLAKKYNGSICTIDFNLNKVAVVENIPVLNINELAQQLRMNHLPGERMSLAISQKGNDNHQGVGYLSDGTMVAVENAKSDIGSTVEVEFIRSIQTVAGRMLFAKKCGDTAQKHAPKSIDKVKSQRKSSKQSSRRTSRRAESDLVDLANK